MNNTIIIPPSHHVAEIAGAAAGVLGIAALALVAKKVLPKSRSRAQRRNRVHFAEPITDYEPVSESNDSLVEATEPLGEHILAEPLIAVAGEDDVKVVIQELAEPATIVESPIIVPAAKIKDVSPAKTNFKENAAPRFKEDVARAKKENDDEEHLSWAEARNKFEKMARPSPKNEKRSLSDKFLSSGTEVKPLLTMKHQVILFLTLTREIPFTDCDCSH